MSAIVRHPRAVELIERRTLRRKVERAVPRLIDVLDELDSDPQAEPWLGAAVVLDSEQDDQRLWATGANDAWRSTGRPASVEGRPVVHVISGPHRFDARPPSAAGGSRKFFVEFRIA